MLCTKSYIIPLLGTGISPESKSATTEQGDVDGSTANEEQKLVRAELISAYDRAIVAGLKAELCSMESNNYTDNKRDSPTSSKFSFINLLEANFIKHFSSFCNLCRH